MTTQNWFRLGVVVLVGCVLVINFTLMRQNENIKDQLDQVIHKEFHPGDTLKSFGGVDAGGRFATASFVNAPKQTLLIAFSTGCSASKANLENWITLSSQLSKDQWRVLWISRDPDPLTEEFTRSHGITGEVLSELSCSTSDYLGLRMVPRMVVVDRDGKIRKIWNGALTGEEWDEVFEYFRARPVLAAAAASR